MNLQEQPGVETAGPEPEGAPPAPPGTDAAPDPTAEGAAFPRGEAPAEGLEEVPEEYRYLPDVPRGLSGEAADVAEILASLARTSRSFLFYAPNNRALRLFMENLESRLANFLEAHGPIHLQVEAIRFLYGGKVVHEDTDRERSLPFKLFRDGVRGLTVFPGVTSEELARLLNILSIRLIGVHRHDEDIVTQLWRADLEHVRHDVVEGFTHEIYGGSEGGERDADAGAAVPRIMARLKGEEDRAAPPRPKGTLVMAPQGRGPGGIGADGGVGERGGSGGDASGSGSPGPAGVGPQFLHALFEGEQVPADHVLIDDGVEIEVDASRGPSFAHATYPGIVHYEIPSPRGAVEVASSPLDAADIDYVRTELEREEHDGLIQLTEALFAVSTRRPDLVPPDDAATVAIGARRSMVREERLGDLVGYYAFLRQVIAARRYPDVADALTRLVLPEYASGPAIRDVVALGARGGGPERVSAYLDHVGGEANLEALLPLLEFHMPAAVLDEVLGRVLHLTGFNVPWYAARMEDVGDVAAGAYLRALHKMGTQEATALLCRHARHPHPIRRLQALEYVGAAAPSPMRGETLSQLLADRVVAVRTRAYEVLATRSGAESYPPLEAWLAGGGLTALDAEELPRVLLLAADLGRDRAVPFLRKIIKVPTRWKLTNPTEEARSQAAIEAIVHIGTEVSEAAIRGFKDSGTVEWRRFALRAFLRAHRKRAGAQG